MRIGRRLLRRLYRERFERRAPGHVGHSLGVGILARKENKPLRLPWRALEVPFQPGAELPQIAGQFRTLEHSTHFHGATKTPVYIFAHFLLHDPHVAVDFLGNTLIVKEHRDPPVRERILASRRRTALRRVVRCVTLCRIAPPARAQSVFLVAERSLGATKSGSMRRFAVHDVERRAT